MATYSHSRVSSFENCPYQYKLKYIDKVKVDIPTTIEMFMGGIVHEALEKLYKDKKFGKTLSKENLIKFYKEKWVKEYSEDILIVKKHLTANNYRKMGEKFISDYYERFKPFESLTIIGLETQDRMTLPDGNQWHVRIDKLACDDKGNYYVCDYKTNARMKMQEEADSDRQLAMYSGWVKDKFKDAKKVILTWHMLAFDKDVTSERTEDQIKKLQEEIMVKISQMENAKDFPRNQSGLCDYCVYKQICPSFKHEFELEQKKIKDFKKDEGVNLVDEFSEIKTKIAELKEQEIDFKDKLIKYSKQFDVDSIYGSNKIANIKEFNKVVMPEGADKEKFVELLKKKGLYVDCSMVCYPKLNSQILKGDLPKDVQKKVDIIKDYRINLKKKDVD